MKCCECNEPLSLSTAWVIDGDDKICLICYRLKNRDGENDTLLTPSQRVVSWLNRLVKMKHGGPALRKLIDLRVSVNEELAHDRHLVVNSSHQVSAIGLLNGALTAMGYKRIAYQLDDKTKNLVGFQIYEEQNENN